MYSELNGIRGVYKISSIINPERIYIGHSVNIGKRWRDHVRELFKNKHGCHKLQNHYNKYGSNDLIFSLILLCDDNDLVTDEQYFIDTLKPYFNECPIARSCLGLKRTPESIEKRASKLRGRKRPPITEEWRKNLSEAGMGHEGYWLGKKHSKEACEKMSAAGKLAWENDTSNKRRNLMSEKLKGNKNRLGKKHGS